MAASLFKKALPFVVVAGALVACVFPLLRSGFSIGDDWSYELVRIAEYRYAWIAGQHPPFWASDLYGGYGSPIFLFYAPLYMALSAGLVSFTHDVIAAATVSLTIFSILGVVLMWRLIRQISLSPAAARVGAMIYALYPYFLADKWLRNADAEFAALSIFPAVLIGATARERNRAFWWTVVSFSGLILAHNITALIGVPVAIAVSFMIHRTVRSVVPVLLGIAAALAVTAFFWVPAFTLKPLIHTHDLLIGKFDFHYQFPPLLALVWPSRPYSPGCLAVLLFVAAILLPAKDAYARRVQHALLACTAVLVVMMLSISTTIWEAVPLLPYVQFPWRLIGPIGIFLAAAAAIAWTQISWFENKWWVEVAVLCVLLLNAYPAFRAYQPIPPDVRHQGDEALTPQGIEKRKLSTTAYDEYVPIGGLFLRQPPPTEKGKTLFEKWFFPVWSATVDGKTVPVEPGINGILFVPVDSENASVRLSLIEPTIRTQCKMISLVSTLGLACFAIFQLLWRVKK